MLIVLCTLESSIIIATHSRLVPRPPTIPAFNEMDLAMSMDMQPPLSIPTSYKGDDWENWTDEPAIELCEIRLGLDFDSVNMSTHTSSSSCNYNLLQLLTFHSSINPSASPSTLSIRTSLKTHVRSSKSG